MIPKPSSCVGCPLYSGPFGRPNGGFSRPDGTGTNGVLMVGEALGENEEQAGFAFVGKAGHFFFTQLNRVGIQRDDFYIHNTISCRPPDNKLAKMPWEKGCIEWCAPNLDRVIAEARSIAIANKRHFTILTVGKIAFKRVMGYTPKDPIMGVDYLNYPFW
jgi:uracil-DNA glycosylase family 4